MKAIAIILAISLIVLSIYGCGKDTEQERAIKLIRQAKKELHKADKAVERNDMQRYGRAQGKAIDIQMRIQAIGAPAVEPLIAALIEPDEDSTILDWVADALGGMNASAIDPLIALLDDYDTPGRTHWNIAVALAKTQNEQVGLTAMDAIVSYLDSAVAEVRADSAHILGNIAVAQENKSIMLGVVQPLSDLLKDQVPIVRYRSAYALYHIGIYDEQAISALERVAEEDPDESVRNMAGEALMKLRPKRDS